MSSLIHVIYNSAATKIFSDEDLATLLLKARDKNAALQITGMLLYVEGCFFQILEGPQDNVERLIESISADPRHERLTTIMQEPIAKRSFTEWTMGFTRMSIDDFSHIEGLNDFFSTGKVLTEIDAGRAKKLLTAFSRGRWRLKLSADLTPTPQLSEPTVRRLAAQPRPDFSFAFQPIVDANQRRVVGYEALIRTETGGAATSVLQRVQLNEVSSFDEDARRKAISLAVRLGFNGRLHLNALMHSVTSVSNSISSSLDTAERCGIEVSRLVLELKHEASLADPRAVTDWLIEARKRGLHICIDDFGSGYSGFALLDFYQPEMVSISMDLLRGVESHGPRQAILRGIVLTCSDLGIDLIAKGVETPEEFAWLRDEGIDQFQGFLFAKPSFESLPVPAPTSFNV